MLSSLRLICVAGLVLFVTAFALTFVSPIHYERAAKSYIQSKIESELRDRMPSLEAHPRLEAAARLLKDRYGEEAAALGKAVGSKLSRQIADVIGDLQNADCECRSVLRQRVDATLLASANSLKALQEKLVPIVQGQYARIVGELIHELRLFTGMSLLVFLLLSVALFLKPGARRHLLLPVALMLLATAICLYFYVFQQNWFFNILFMDYVGWSYGIYLLVVFGFLYDIVMNHGRVTVEIVNAIGNAIPNFVPLSPC
ncbi:MAG: hypothetical protein R3F22_02760 [Lysobacteraceae bacterium]